MLGLGLVPAEGQQAQRIQLQPNILVIVLDDVGTEKLSIYGESPSAVRASAPYCGAVNDPYDYPRTPNIEALAAGEIPGIRGGGVRFQRAYAAAVCAPARACFLTGRYGSRTGLGVVDDGGSLRRRLPNEEVLLPELLRNGFAASSKKYRCGAFGKYHVSAQPECDPVVASDFQHPVVNGFHWFQGTMTNVGTTSSNPGNHYNWTKVTAMPGATELTRYQVGNEFLVQPFQFSAACTVPGTLMQTTAYSEETFTPSVTRQDAVQWINAQTQPFFAYVAFNAPHFPYQVPPFSLLSPETQAELSDPGNCRGPYCPGQLSGATGTCGTSSCGDATACTYHQDHLFYDAMLEAVDTEIGRLFAQMAPHKRANTMVFLIADNGTPSVAVDRLLHDPLHAKATTYELGVRVPLVVAGPLVPRGEHQSEALVHGVDLWRTLAEVSGASETLAAPLQPVDSISFKNVLLDPAAPTARTEAFCQTFVQPGRYVATEHGPYEEACADPLVPGVYQWQPRNVGNHARSLCDGRYKLIVLQTSAGVEVAPPGTPDIAPSYKEELYDLLLDPAETNDLVPLLPGDTVLQAIRDGLRDRITQLSGY